MTNEETETLGITREESKTISFKHIDEPLRIINILYSERYNYYIKREKGGIQAAYFKTQKDAEDFIKQYLPRYYLGKIENDA